MTPRDLAALRAAASKLGSAHATGDRESWRSAWSRMQEALVLREPERNSEIGRARVADWRVEEDEAGGAEGDGSAAVGEIIVMRDIYGVTVSARPPGSDLVDTVSINFDQGATKVSLFKGGAPEPQAIAHIDGRGAHVANGTDMGPSEPSLTTVFAGDAGAQPAEDEWSPDESGPSLPAP